MGTSLRNVLVVIALVSVLSGCGRQRAPQLQPPAPMAQSSKPLDPLNVDLQSKRPKDHVAPGFEVQITSAEDERLNGTFRIAFNGNLKLPYDIVIDTKGLGEKELREKIALAYRNFFQGEPTLQIAIATREYWIEVAGLVQKPGQYLVKEDSTIDEVLALAGGVTVAADNTVNTPQYVRIERDGKAVVIKLSDYYAGELRFRGVWHGGESIFVQRDRGGAGTLTGVEPNYVKILGEVRHPGEYIARDNADFYQYLIRAGGPTDRAALRAVSIIRGTESGNQLYSFNAENREDLPKIYGGDVILVNADNPTEAEDNVQFAGSVAAVISSLATIIILAVTL